MQESQISYTSPKKIAVLYISTGRYICFWNDFYTSAEKHFLPRHKKTYFLFTDHDDLSVPDNVVKIHQEQLPRPYITLKRYHFFSAIESLLKKFDYIYFVNGNTIITQDINEEIAFSKNSITLGDYNLVKKPLEGKNNIIAKMASIKEKEEIEHLKSAFFRLDKALKSFKNRIKAGLSEYELKEIFEEELLKFGAKTTSFKTILAISDNSSSIHYSNYDKNKILKEGDLVLLDCGGYYEMGLATDITRVFVCGSPLKNSLGKKQKEIYTAVLKAFLNCYHSNAHTGADLDKIARKILTPKAKEGFLFPHALGHGIGIPVHQCPPVISSCGDKKFPLYKNMVHSIEPGLYCENKPYKFGVRLENTVFVTGRGKRESLSRFEFEEKLIERSLLTKKEQKWLDLWQQTAEKI